MCEVFQVHHYYRMSSESCSLRPPRLSRSMVDPGADVSRTMRGAIPRDSSWGAGTLKSSSGRALCFDDMPQASRLLEVI